ncbi:MAG: glycosyltransferase, partial [Acidaminococcaceae bacterium]
MSDEKPIISIIVPVYNVEQYIAKCLASIQAQTFSNFEAILVDDGSPDNCGKICDAFAATDTRFCVIHQVNGGLSNARNSGLSVAKGKYIGFVDSDDSIAPDMYEKLYNEAIRTGADIVICDHFRVEEGKNVPRNSFAKNQIFNNRDLMHKLADDDLTSYIWCKLYKKELFGEIKFIEEHNFEDLAIFHELVYQAKTIAYLHDCLYYYFINPKGLVVNLTTKNEYDRFFSWHRRKVFLQKHFPDIVGLTYDYFINFGARAYWLCAYREKDE